MKIYCTIDMAKKGGDKTSVAVGKVDPNGRLAVKFIVDEAGSWPNYKWYRNPIKWYKWRRMMKHIDRAIENGKKNGTVWTSW